MRAREMQTLCCINIDAPSTPLDPDRTLEGAGPSEAAVAGILYKWTNYRRGWRARWFSLRRGLLSYSKIRVLPEAADASAIASADDNEFRLIGDPAAVSRIRTVDHAGVVQLKVSSFRESRSDDRRFYIFSAAKTLHLKTYSKKDRCAWIEALASTSNSLPFRPSNEQLFIHNGVSLSTARLRKRLHEEGLSEGLIKDCEQIMQSEFSQLRLLYEDRFNLFSFRQLEDVNIDEGTAGIQDARLLDKNGFCSSGHGKFSEYSTTESSDDIGKLEPDVLSEEDESSYFDTNESFFDSSLDCDSGPSESLNGEEPIANMTNSYTVCTEAELFQHKFPHVERRIRLPVPAEKEKGVSLWSLIKDNVGKDLTRVCLPVYFNEPLSSLQKCFEDLEYSYLLDRAYEYGKMGNSLMRILNVAAFAVSGYASTDGRLCKPFNPLLGETYEAEYPEKGIHFISEKVSHHPTIVACHCEGRGWKYWGDSNLKSRFWGRSIQLDPVGVITVEFDDGEIFQWNKVTTSIYNLILGRIYCDHHGTMAIQGNREYSCNLKFKEQSLFDRNPHQVLGFVEDARGRKVASLLGKWDDSMYYVEREDISKEKISNLTQDASLLWKKNEPAPDPTRYNLTSFGITLNEMTSYLQQKLPPTDSRRRPDQRHLENGEYEKANAEKQRLEKRQRMSRSIQESGWKPRWFRKQSNGETYLYIGGYWEARKENKWEGCPNIFGECLDEEVDLHSNNLA